jgi:hypothetical protein
MTGSNYLPEWLTQFCVIQVYFCDVETGILYTIYINFVLQSFTWFSHKHNSKLSTVIPAFNAISKLHFITGHFICFILYIWELAPINSWSQVFRDVNSPRSFEGLQCLHLWGHTVQEKLVCCSFEALATTQPTIQCHIPEDLHPQQHHCEDLKSCTEISITANGSTVNGTLQKLEKRAFADVCTLTF